MKEGRNPAILAGFLIFTTFFPGVYFVIFTLDTLDNMSDIYYRNAKGSPSPGTFLTFISNQNEN